MPNTLAKLKDNENRELVYTKALADIMQNTEIYIIKSPWTDFSQVQQYNVFFFLENSTRTGKISSSPENLKTSKVLNYPFDLIEDKVFILIILLMTWGKDLILFMRKREMWLIHRLQGICHGTIGLRISPILFVRDFDWTLQIVDKN